MKRTINIDDLLVKISLIFPAAVLLQGLPGLGWINKFIVAVMMLLMLWQMRSNHRIILSMALCGVMSIITVVLSNRVYFRAQDVAYFPLFVLYLLYWTERSEKFQQTLLSNLSFGMLSVAFWGLLIGASLFFQSSYRHEAMNTMFFVSFANCPFRLASSCLVIMLMLYILAYHKSVMWFLLEAIPLAVIMTTGTRVYLLVGMGIFMLLFYLMFRRKRVFFALLIPVMAVMVIAVGNSSIVDKLVLVARSQRTLYGNYLDAFTSGRTIFWRLDLEAFFDLPFWKQLIGNGSSFPYEVTAVNYVSSIWAHNDFINILMAYGWIGLALYVYSYMALVLKFRKTYSVNVLFCLAAVGISMGNALINGLYFYSAALMATPFLFYAMSLDRSKQAICK